jgi:hypothetical protein
VSAEKVLTAFFSPAEIRRALISAKPKLVLRAVWRPPVAVGRHEGVGAHFREESQTPDGEALRDDENFAYVAAWEYAGEGKPPILNKEPLVFENVKFSQRSYK